MPYQEYLKTFDAILTAARKAGFPIVLKSNGHSVGIGIIKDEKSLKRREQTILDALARTKNGLLVCKPRQW